MSLQKYFIRRAFLSKTKPKGFSNVANPKPALNLNEHINDVVVESQSYSVTLDTTGPVSVTSGTTTTVNGGTGAQVIATTGELDLTATAANVAINAATTVTVDSGTTTTITAGNLLSLNAATGSANLTAPTGNVALVPGLNLIFILSAIPTYADDTAAGVGELTAGMVYKQATGELMIKL